MPLWTYTLLALRSSFAVKEWVDVTNIGYFEYYLNLK